MKIGFFHHGAAPSAEVAEKLAGMRVAVAGRNATQYSPADGEKFTEVIVDEGANTAAIREFYESQGIPVHAIEQFLAGKTPSAPSKVEAPTPDLDKAVKAKREGRNQGATANAAMKPKPAKVEAPSAAAEANGEGEAQPAAAAK